VEDPWWYVSFLIPAEILSFGAVVTAFFCELDTDSSSVPDRNLGLDFELGDHFRASMFGTCIDRCYLGRFERPGSTPLSRNSLGVSMKVPLDWNAILDRSSRPKIGFNCIQIAPSFLEKGMTRNDVISLRFDPIDNDVSIGFDYDVRDSCPINLVLSRHLMRVSRWSATARLIAVPYKWFSHTMFSTFVLPFFPNSLWLVSLISSF